jgi:hypothetical protein
MEASIGVSKPTKAGLEQAKPAGISWDDFLVALRASVDARKLRKNLARLLDDVEAESVEAATKRVLEMRSGKAAAMRLAEAKQRLKQVRLARELRHVSQLLTDAPDVPETRRAVEALDEKIHALI